MNRILLTLLLLTAPAHELLAGTAYFDIELLLFERTDPSAEKSEFWSAKTQSSPPAGAINIQSGGSAGYRLLPESSRQLSPDAYTLDRSGRFKTLAHLKWRQPGVRKSRAKPIYIRENNLEGTVTVSLGRFLHVDFDMLLRRFSPRQGNYKSVHFGEHRKMRSGEVHYIDHPILGALIKIRHIQPAAPKTDETATQETSPKPEQPVGKP